jgi:hypothetical protein
VYLLILVWWIACLWIEEPGAKPGVRAEGSTAEPAAPALEELPAKEE